MESSYFARLVVVTLIAASLSLTGCSTFKSIYESGSNSAKSISRSVLPGNKSALRKKVLVAPVINTAGFNDQMAGQLTGTWMNLLKEDHSLSITPLTGSEISGPAAASSESGVVIDPELIKKAEELGMNILVTKVMEPLDYSAKKRGIWPFRKLKGEYEVLMIVNAVDIINGTIILSSRNTEKIKIGPVPEGQKTPPEPGEKALTETLNKIQKTQSSALLHILASQEWKGKIILDGDRIKINGGADIGITKGSVFNVFEKGVPIKSENGKVYYVEGKKTGEISVVDVKEDLSFAVPLGNKGFENGQIITLKSK